MIGSRFTNYLKSVPPRNLPRLNLFVDYLKLKTDEGIKRADHLTPNSYGVRLLVEIIKLADLPKLLLPGDPYRKTGLGLLPIVKDLEKMIDVRTGKHTTRSLFVNSKTPCFELMTPSRRMVPIIDIPFDLPYSNPQWADIHPLRISDMAPTDLKFNVHTGYLQYPTHGPVYAVYSLDCLALVAKFIAYYKAQSHVNDLDQCLLDFLHRDVVTPTLLRDSTAIWLRNAYRSQLVLESPLESLTSTMWDNVNLDTIGSNFTGAMSEIRNLKQDLRNQSIGALTALNSMILSVDRLSFSNYYKDLYATTTTPNEQPYFWVECIKNLSWWNFIILVTSYVPDLPESISIQRNIARDIRLWLMAKPWNEIHGSIPFKMMIRHQLEGLSEYLRAQN